jgi:hypothetical protein
MSMPLGMALVGIQMLAARNDMFSNVYVKLYRAGRHADMLSSFEIAIATFVSFIAAGLASTGVFCYTALVSGGVVLILPVRLASILLETADIGVGIHRLDWCSGTGFQEHHSGFRQNWV